MSDETWERTTTNRPEIDVEYRQEGNRVLWRPVEGLPREIVAGPYFAAGAVVTMTGTWRPGEVPTTTLHVDER